jgi:hypothetical protein
MSTYFVDIIMGVIALVVLVWAIKEKLLRTAIDVILLYFSTMIAGLLYPLAVAYFGPVTGMSPMFKAVLFWIIFVIVLLVAEFGTRRAFPDTWFPKLRVFDNILAILPAILSALIICSMFLAIWSYVRPGLPAFRTSVSCRYISQFHDIYLGLHPWFRAPREEMLTNSPPCTTSLP